LRGSKEIDAVEREREADADTDFEGVAARNLTRTTSHVVSISFEPALIVADSALSDKSVRVQCG